MKVVKRSISSVFVLCLVILLITTYVNTQTGYSSKHIITLAAAQKYVKNFRDNPTVPQIKGGSFDRDVFDAILAQPNCSGIRFYYAKEDDGSHTIVVVGINSSGNDIETGVIAEKVNPCPPFCDSQGSLNK